MRSDTDFDRPFLGRGWAFPPRISGGDLATVSAETDIEQAIRIILETPPGSRVMRPDFGIGLKRMVFNPLSFSTLSIVQFRIEQALLLWEPRIDVKSVKIQLDSEQPGRLLINIRYLVRESNTIANFVYPFYLTEARQA